MFQRFLCKKFSMEKKQYSSKNSYKEKEWKNKRIQYSLQTAGRGEKEMVCQRRIHWWNWQQRSCSRSSSSFRMWKVKNIANRARILWLEYGYNRVIWKIRISYALNSRWQLVSSRIFAYNQVKDKIIHDLI